MTRRGHDACHTAVFGRTHTKVDVPSHCQVELAVTFESLQVKCWVHMYTTYLVRP